MPSAFFIDGFNLFYGMRDSNWKKLYWLDLNALCIHLNGGDPPAFIGYFTTRIKTSGDAAKRDRQNAYIDALSSTPAVKIHYGQYFSKQKRCSSCGHTWTIQEEKMTDVKIALSMVENATNGVYDEGYLISADSDLNPAVACVKRMFPKTRIHAVFPPNRNSDSLKGNCDSHSKLSWDMLNRCQFPHTVTTARGFTVSRPADWK